MDISAPKYSLSVANIAGPVTAYRGDTVLASSNRARVMFETRREPVIYFPREDIRVPISEPTATRTFCPFKGTASYRDIEVGGAKLRDAMWSYLQPLPEAEEVGNCLAFSPDAVERWDIPKGAILAPEDPHVTGVLVDWMMLEAWACPDAETLTRTFAHRLISDGIAVSRVSFLIRSLHPQIIGRVYVWSRSTDEIESFEASFETLEDDSYLNSPIRHVIDGLGGVRQSLTVEDPEFDFPVLAELREAGATDYIAMPLVFSDGQINVLTLATEDPDGFSTASLGHIFESSAVLSRLYEVINLRQNTETLLGIYLGHRTGARVLGGQIRRGEGEDIDAAILFCDLRGSTVLEERLSRSDYLALLNAFFDTTIAEVEAHGGEVLKLIGDAVLAIFPVDDGAEEAIQRAVKGAMSIVKKLGPGSEENGAPPLECAIGVSFGSVTYGNVGSSDRLDFTVIGAAASIAARLSDQCKDRDCPILFSDRIAKQSSVPTTSLGRIALHNVSEAVEVFVPDYSASGDTLNTTDKQPITA